MQPLIERDKNLRCPLWIWVQAGEGTAVEALLRNIAHDEEVDVDVMVALQRCRGDETARQQITDRIREHVGGEEFRRLETAAATRRLLFELREAHSDERDVDLGIVYDTLAHGADPNAREEDVLDDVEDELEEDNEVDEEEDDDDEDDGDQQEDEEDLEEYGELADDGEGGDDDTVISRNTSTGTRGGGAEEEPEGELEV